MLRTKRAPRHVHLIGLLLVVLNAGAANGQTTAFTYQGQLSDTGALASGNYDLRFALFDTAEGGAQIGADQTIPAVPLSGGVFTVQLDFGASAFPGTDRFLEIGVKPAGGGSFTTLAPRQQISSSPYAIRTLSAATADALSSACVGCVQSGQINSVAGSKVTGTIPAASVPTGSGNYIQNTSTQQASSNFNISGNGVIGGDLTVAGMLNANVSGNFIQNGTTAQAGANFNVGGNGTVGDLLSAGRVGIGTSNPAAKLTVSGSGAFNAPDAPRFDLFNTTANIGYLQHITDIGLWQIATTTGATRMVIAPSGNIGIGTTNPVSGRLQVDVVSGNGDDAVIARTFKTAGRGVHGIADNGTDARGVFGESLNGVGVYGKSVSSVAVAGFGGTTGVFGTADTADGNGVFGLIQSDHPSATGVSGAALSGTGVRGNSSTGVGVYGRTDAVSTFTIAGVVGEAGGDNNIGVRGVANHGTTAWAINGESTTGYAGYFSGKVNVTGALTAGVKPFKIDHPLDPANKYLMHAAVESPDMKNIYDGIAVLDAGGEAVVELPEWFEALNRDFRYQLTCIGGVAPVYIAEEVSDHRFRIAGGAPGLKVSWQVTGIRKDAFANAHPLEVEVDKSAEERGRYLYPVELGMPASLSVDHAKQAAAQAQVQ